MDSSLVYMIPLQLENDGTLLFVEEEGLESDSFEISGKYKKAQILMNRENEVLMAHPMDTVDAAHFETINERERNKASGIRFDIHSYKDTLPRGLPVAFSTQWNNANYFMYVERRDDSMKVAFKRGNLPTKIDEDRSDILFFQSRFSKGDGRYYKFESTLEEDHFLAFEKDKQTNTSKLILKKKPKGKVDEYTKIHIGS